MEHKGESIKNAIHYLDNFYKDLGQMFGKFEGLLSDNNFSVHPAQKNKTSFMYDLSNNINWSATWNLKNIQRYYVHDDDIENDKTDRAVFSSISLYPEGEFNFPVLICGVIYYSDFVSLNELWNYWLWKEITEIDNAKGCWKINEKHNKGNIFNLKCISNEKIYDKTKIKSEIISYANVIFVDLIKIENSELLNDLITPLIDLYKNGSSDLQNDNLFVKSIPKKLIDSWSK